MPKDNESKSREVKDYFEYSEKERSQNPDLNGIGRRLSDGLQASFNAIVADATLKGRKNDTVERYDLSAEEIDDFLIKEYQDEYSKEYLVDGAILTCTNCTNRQIEIEAGGKKLPYFARIDTSIDTDLINGWESGKVAGRLIASDNPLADANGFIHATIADCIGKDKDNSEKPYNIPNFGNCLR